MGDKFHGIDKEMALFLKRQFYLNTFVETGTFRGDTASWASQHFSHVHTVDVFKNYIEGAKKTTCAGRDNVEFYLGQSDEILPEILSKVGAPALIWLDAHWGGDLHYGKPDVECPLMGELSAISEVSNIGHLLMIDDARLFIHTPDAPLTPEKWPNVKDIIEILKKMNYYTVVIDDTILGLPRGTFGLK